MADAELEARIVPDEEALNNIEEKQLEISGEPDSVGDAKELNEEQNQKLQRTNRSMKRIVGRLGVLGIIAGTLGVLAKTIGEIFNISFSDVRNAIVETLNELKNQFAGFIQSIPTAAGQAVGLDSGTVNRIQGAQAGAPFGLFGMLAGAMTGDANTGGSADSGTTSNQNLNLFTSRDALVGDSTQQEMQGESITAFSLQGGASGGSIPE